jgi:hypothetical protein
MYRILSRALTARYRCSTSSDEMTWSPRCAALSLPSRCLRLGLSALRRRRPAGGHGQAGLRTSTRTDLVVSLNELAGGIIVGSFFDILDLLALLRE